MGDAGDDDLESDDGDAALEGVQGDDDCEDEDDATGPDQT